MVGVTYRFVFVLDVKMMTFWADIFQIFVYCGGAVKQRRAFQR